MTAIEAAWIRAAFKRLRATDAFAPLDGIPFEQAFGAALARAMNPKLRDARIWLQCASFGQERDPDVREHESDPFRIPR